MKIALVHYWLVGMRGGERVLESVCRMFPSADIYTHVIDREQVSDVIKAHRIETSWIARLPLARRLYRKYLVFMPMALEALDLTSYDVVISFEAGPAKGVITRPDALQVTYCHSPMRYIWDHYHLYRAGAGRLTRLMMGPISHYVRLWDAVSAARTDAFVANSRFIAQRIRAVYRRPATVVYPPVAVEAFAAARPVERDPFYLWCGELVPYKRPELAIEAFNASGRPLLIVGSGGGEAALRKMAGPNISFAGKLSFAELQAHFAACRALVFTGEEDFGITPVEVQAAGRPVIALARGGALETVIDGETGLFFPTPDAAALNATLDRFEAGELPDRCAEACRANARRFGEEQFQQGFRAALNKAAEARGLPAFA